MSMDVDYVRVDFVSYGDAARVLDGWAVAATTHDDQCFVGVLHDWSGTGAAVGQVRLYDVIKPDELALGTDIRNFKSIVVL
jgi:hypothetical protein